MLGAARIALLAAGLWIRAGRAQQAVSFQNDVLPVLSGNCFKCHGEALKLSGLDLRSRESMLKGGQHGPVIVPGNPEGSRLYRLVSGKDKPPMPLGGKLTEAQIAVLRDWINQGARWEGAGPRVENREKDNPQYRFEYLDDMIAATSQAFLGLTVQCARCHDHKFDPIPQKDYYRMQASFFGYVDVDHYLVSDEENDAIRAKLEEIEEKIKPLREEIAEIEVPYKEKVFIAEVLHRFPEDAQIAVKTPEAQRTPGEKLLAGQLIRAVGVPPGAVEKALTPEDRRKRDAPLAEIRKLETQRPKLPPAASVVTDGDYRFAPDSYGDEPPPGKGVKKEQVEGSFLHKGPGPYVPPAFVFPGPGARRKAGARGWSQASSL